MSVTGWDGVTLTVEVALSAATSVYGVWDAAIWDTSLWGPDVVWTDVSDYVRSVRTQRGFSREVQEWGGGTATIVLDNRDARFDPSNLDGPYVTGDVTQIRPLRPVRVTASYNSVSYPVWRGYVMSWGMSWSVAATDSGDAVAVLECADEFARLAAIDGVAVDPAVGAGELSGTRVHRVLDAAAYSGERDVDTGESTLQATTLGDSTLSELAKVVEAEGGSLYVSASGAITFEGRYALIENSRSISSQATFGDSGSDLRYADAALAYDGDLVVNVASYTRVDGSAQDAADATSQALYGERRDTRSDLICETDATALALAQWTVQQYMAPELRFTSVTLKPRRDPAGLWPQALGRLVRDMVTVNRHPPGGHEISQACHIAGVSHDIAPDQWVTTFELWSASLYGQYASSRWDQATWDESLWFF